MSMGKWGVGLLAGAWVFSVLPAWAVDGAVSVSTEAVAPAPALAPAPAPPGQETVQRGEVYRRHLVSLDLWSGYTYMLFNKVNQEAQRQADNYRSAGYTQVGVDELHGGIHSGLDLNFEVVQGLKLGPRIGVLYAFPGDVYATDPYYHTKSKYTTQGFVVPVSLGLSYSFPPMSMVKFSVGTDLGMAAGFGSWEHTYHSYYGDRRDQFTSTATGFYGDLFMALKLAFAEHFGMDFRLGFHTASLSDWSIVSTSGNAITNDVGDPVEDMHGDPLVVDFTGVDGLLSLNFTF
jgi:hypothetical protein